MWIWFIIRYKIPKYFIKVFNNVLSFLCSIQICSLQWLTKLTRQTLYIEKTIGEVHWRQWGHRDWMWDNVYEIAFCYILFTSFVRIVIRTWFMEKDFGIDCYHYHYYDYYYFYHYHDNYYFYYYFIVWKSKVLNSTKFLNNAFQS